MRSIFLCITNHFTTLCLQSSQPNSNGISMSLQPFPLGESNDSRSKIPQSIRSKLLRSDVFLERQRVDTRELPCETVCGEGMVGSRGVISASNYQRRAKRGGLQIVERMKDESGKEGHTIQDYIPLQTQIPHSQSSQHTQQNLPNVKSNVQERSHY